MMLNSILTACAFTDSRFGEQSDNPLICRKYIRNIINYRLHVWMLVWCLFQNINDYLSELILKLQFFYTDPALDVRHLWHEKCDCFEDVTRGELQMFIQS